MQNACRFARRSMRVARRQTGPGPARAPAAPRQSDGGHHAGRNDGRNDSRGPCADALADLLAGLRGRKVTLQVGARLRTGKVILADPVVLVDGEGRATFVRPDAILAVTF